MANRAAAILLQLGVVAVIIAAAPYKLFELDRYFVPKELVVHVAALFIAVLLVARRRTINIDLADALLALFLAWSAVAALFATNHWAAQRALGLSVSSALIFWGARRLGALGMFRPILVAAGFTRTLPDRAPVRAAGARIVPPLTRSEAHIEETWIEGDSSGRWLRCAQGIRIRPEC